MAVTIRFGKQSSVAILLVVFIILASFQFEDVKGNDIACIAECSDFPLCTLAVCEDECHKQGFKKGGFWVYFSYNLHCCCTLPNPA